MIAKILRFDPHTDEKPYYREYDVPLGKESRMTVMALLEYIADNIDSSLSFYSHSACRHGICGRCALKLNGRPVLACCTVLFGDTVTIEPLKQAVVKDLVLRR